MRGYVYCTDWADGSGAIYCGCSAGWLIGNYGVALGVLWATAMAAGEIGVRLA